MKLKQIMEAIGLKQAELTKLISESKNADGTFEDATDDQVKAIETLETELKDLDEKRAEAEAKQKTLEDAEKSATDFEAKNVAFIKSQRPSGTLPERKGGDPKLHLSFKGVMTDDLAAKFQQTGFQHEFRDMDVKTLFSTTNGGPRRNEQEDRIVRQPEREIRLFDYLPTSFDTSDRITVDYYSETARTNAAAFRNESTQATASPLAESEFGFEILTAKAEMVGHILPVTEEQMMDHPELTRILDTLMVWGVRDKAETMGLQGNGTAPNVRGLLNYSGIGTQAKGADTIQDAIVKACTKVAVDGEAQADFLVIHPSDVEDVLLTKDGNQRPISSEDYPKFNSLFRNRLETTAIPAGTALVGARQYVLFEFINAIGVQNGTIGSDFQNMVRRLRAWTRMRTRVFRATALCKVTGL